MIDPRVLMEDIATADDVQPVTVSVTDTGGVSQSQLSVSLPEMKAMQRMPGGVCMYNWMKIRGLLDEQTRES